MCGIVGLLIRRPELRARLGELAVPMLDCMGDRGPDSAGLAVFDSQPKSTRLGFSLYWREGVSDWDSLLRHHRERVEGEATLDENGDNGLLWTEMTQPEVAAWLGQDWPGVSLLSAGNSIRLYKDEGHPREIAMRYGFASFSGSHLVGHTRMATESMVSPAHAHPFTAGQDFCLVHNGSLSNPNSVRRRLQRQGIAFETDNDTEAGCRYLEWRMREGDSLEEAIESSFGELDGFFTFLMATDEKMVLVRDAFACKPAVVAETDDYVAVGSEFRALAHLPGVADANVFEPAPRVIYSWSVSEAEAPQATAVAS
ncbi:MAG: amidophosphoribosyltransferase [Planctomycetaceae bacterium]|nr:amidophosphoribosyltransferase [Planctomycetaceae bacterium]|tara:strand:+ start:827 stop:1762 length:936 start_codon:yes stop_codon:yes gene_type:complete